MIFPRIKGVDDTAVFARRLLAERGTAVVPGYFFESPAHFRIGIGGLTTTVDAGLDAVRAALDARAW